VILTLTPNPSVDRTCSIEHLERGAVIRALDSREDPGGKGLNVSRALALNGTATAAVFPVGGVYGTLMLELLAAEPIDLRPVRIGRPIRANTTVVEPDGTTTKLNEPGPELAPAEVGALRDQVRSAAASADWVVCCGSLPPGVAEDFYADLITQCRAAGAKVAVDTSGGPLLAALDANPDLIKPNRVELAEAVGHDLATLGAVADAALSLVSRGVGTVVVSLGRDGALLVDRDQVLHAWASIAAPVSTVGAGDALLAGYLHAADAGADAATALCTAVRFGAAAVQLPGSQMPGPGHVGAVEVTLVPGPALDRVLAD